MTDSEYLEKLYLPSKWSKRLSSDVIVDKHIEIVSKGIEKARQGIPCDLNISYGSKEKEKIDIFGTDLANEAPIVVFVHGGYWQEESLKRDTYHFIASNLYKNGVKSIFVGYELCPKVSLQEIIKEIEIATIKCINYAIQNNSRGLYLTGYSAGSHLLAALFTNLTTSLTKEKQHIIKAAILISGIYDLSEIPKTSVNLPLKLNEETALRLSPYKQNIASDVTTSFYVISAQNDSPEFNKQSKNFHDKLRNLGLESTLVVVKEVDHFNIVELLANEDFEVSKLILNIIKHKP